MTLAFWLLAAPYIFSSATCRIPEHRTFIELLNGNTRENCLRSIVSEAPPRMRDELLRLAKSLPAREVSVK